MSELVERVARALCSLEGSGGFCSCVGSDLGCKNGRGEQRYAEGCIATHAQLALSGNKGRALAAISAILQDHAIVPLEPTEAMIEAATATTGYRGDWTATDYRAMIAAAPEVGE